MERNIDRKIGDTNRNLCRLLYEPTKSIFLMELQFTVPLSKFQIKWSRYLTIQVYLNTYNYLKSAEFSALFNLLMRF